MKPLKADVPGDSVSASVAIQMLGDFSISDLPSAAISRKAWAILAKLVMEPGAPCPRERLAGTFWPNLSDAAARGNLRQALLTLQRAFRDRRSAQPCLAADRHAIRFNAQCAHGFDVLAFLGNVPQCPAAPSPAQCESCLAQMEAVVALYRGEFMAGLYLADCPEFDEWLEVQRDTLRRRALALLERLSNCYANRGATGKALSCAERFADLDPWNEEGQRRVMRLLAMNGQRSAALGYYDSCCRMLKQELDVQPAAETQRLIQSIRSGESMPARGDNAGAALPTGALERRQVTVLYCRFAHAETADPDDELELRRGPEHGCIDIVQRCFGHVVRTNDGGMLAYFGYPVARENAARLAVRAALALAARLDLRVGVHTGLMIASNTPGLPDVVGKTSAQAVRLLALAAPATAVVSAATHRLVGGYFECEAIAARQPADDTPAHGAFRVLREGGAVRPAPQAAAPIGRKREIELMTKRWKMARAGKRQVLLLRGDPGIGKSRLVDHLTRQASGRRVAIRTLRCFAEFAHSPFHPLIGMFEELLGFASDDTPETKFDKLATYVGERYADRHAALVPLLAALLSLPTRPPYRALALLPQQLRDRTMDFLIEHLYAPDAHAKALLVVEDLHWIDPSTLELLSRFLADERPAAMLVLLTARQEFQAPWRADAVAELTVAPLADGDMRTLVCAMGLGLADEAVRRIVVRADGVPLFAEELARALPTAADDGHPAIPTTLQDLLAARLDGLGEAKLTAQLAATVGREFPFDLLYELARLDRSTLLQSLARLHDIGLVSGSVASGFQFRHALFQDAAYRCLTRADRQAMHRRIAQVLQARFAAFAGARPEVMARHWTAAGEPKKAIEFWIKAGQTAGLHYAHKEAISHFRSGMALLAELADNARHGLEFELQVRIGAACYATEGYASPDGVAAYRRAVALGEGHNDTQALFQALWGLWASASSRTDYRESLALTQRLIRMAERSGDPVEAQQAHFAAGNIQFWRGEFSDARHHLELVMTSYRPEHHGRHINGFGENAYATSGSFLSWTLCLLGLPDQAEEISRQTLAVARQFDHPFSLGYALTFATVLQRILRQPARCLELAEETIALAQAHGFPLWQAGATLKHGWALAMLGRSEGIEEMRHGVEAVRPLMSSITVIFLETLADGLRHMGQFDEALDVVRQAQETAETLDDRHVEAELHRLKGECLLGLDAANAAQAESCFRRALEVARRQQALLAELRAARSLAGLPRSHGSAAQALLTQTCAKFTEGFGMPDMAAAKRLLAEFRDGNK